MIAWLALIGATALWATSFIAAKWALLELGPLQAVGLRLWVATLVSLPVLFFLRRGGWRRFGLHRVRARDWSLMVLVAGFEPCLYFVAEMHALLYTSAGSAGLLTSTLPVWIAIAARLFLGERLPPAMGLAIAIAFSGAVLLTLVSSPSAHGSNPLLGNLLMALAMVCATGYVLLAKNLTSRVNPWLITLVQAWTGALFFTPFLVLDPIPWASLESRTLLAVIWLGIAITLGAYGLYNLAIRRVSAQTAGMATNLIPLFTLMLAAGFLGERLAWEQAIAAAMILVGVLIAARADKPQLLPRDAEGRA